MIWAWRGLERWVALFAASSAASLPGIPQWAGTIDCYFGREGRNRDDDVVNAWVFGIEGVA